LKLLKNTILLYIFRLLLGFVRVLSTKVFTTILKPIEYGKFSLIMVVISLLTNLFLNPLYQSSLSLIPQQVNNAKKNVLKSTLYTLKKESNIKAFFIILAFLLVLDFANILEFRIHLFFFSFILYKLTADRGLELTVIDSEENFILSSELRLLEEVLKFSFAGLLFFIFAKSVESILIGYTLGFLLIIVILQKLRKGYTKTKNSLNVKFNSDIKNFIKPLYISGFMLWIINISDRIILGLYSDTAIVGKYSANYAICSFPILVLAGTLTTILYPKFFKSKNNTYISYFKKNIKYILPIYIFSLIGISIFINFYGSTITRIFLGSNFQGGSEYIIWLILGYIFYGTSLIFESFLLKSNKTNYISKIYSIISVLNILLTFILCSFLYAEGAAIATFITFLVQLLLNILINLSLGIAKDTALAS